MTIDVERLITLEIELTRTIFWKKKTVVIGYSDIDRYKKTGLAIKKSRQSLLLKSCKICR